MVCFFFSITSLLPDQTIFCLLLKWYGNSLWCLKVLCMLELKSQHKLVDLWSVCDTQYCIVLPVGQQHALSFFLFLSPWEYMGIVRY